MYDSTNSGRRPFIKIFMGRNCDIKDDFRISFYHAVCHKIMTIKLLTCNNVHINAVFSMMLQYYEYIQLYGLLWGRFIVSIIEWGSKMTITWDVSEGDSNLVPLVWRF